MVTDQRVLIATAGIVAVVALIAGAVIYRSSNERYAVTTDSRGVSYKIDRRTGKMWAGVGVLWNEVEAEKPPVVPSDVPQNQIKLIEATGALLPNSRTFSANIYNGTGYALTELRVYLKAQTAGDPWARAFTETLHLEPEKAGTFSIDTADGNLHEPFGWAIISARGHKRNLPFNPLTAVPADPK